ncbi:hypothetical protein GCM10010353_42580 [Streptomyces chryseus]|nr:hypothetical protein GCM10010353_42580 [Streptomyces chryseus]
MGASRRCRFRAVARVVVKRSAGDADMAAIDAAAPQAVASGDRYAPELMQSLNG